jgi:hypothetical protein
VPVRPSGRCDAYDRNYFYMTLEGLYCGEILTNIERALLGRNFDGTKGRLHVKRAAVQRGVCVPTQNLL